MGCFSACFGSCSNRYSKTERHEVIDQKIESRREAQFADPLKIDAEIEEKNEEQLNSSSARKKVTFDSNLKVHEEVCETQSQECAKRMAGEIVKGNGTRKQRENEFQAFLYLKEKEQEKTEGEQGKNKPKFLSDSSEKEKLEGKKTNGEQGRNQVKLLSDSSGKEKTNGKQGIAKVEDVLSDSSQSSLFTYPPNNKYQNCATSDDECEDTAMKDSSLVDEFVSTCKVKDCHAGPMIQEESSESLFSLSIDSRKQSSTPETGDKEVSSPFKPCDKAVDGHGGARNRTQYVDSVLNPIENLNQKVVRTKTAWSMKNQEQEEVNNSEEFTMAFLGKENLNLENQFIIPFSEEPTVKQSKKTSNRPRDDVIAEDTSLSSWLIESENNPIKDNSPASIGNSSSKKTKSPKSFEERPILGALTLDELKQMSRHSSSRRSPSFSPDEKTPTIGTVGSYWRHTRQTADRAQGKMNSLTKPFQTRLEEAMDSVAAEVQQINYF